MHRDPQLSLDAVLPGQMEEFRTWTMTDVDDYGSSELWQEEDIHAVFKDLALRRAAKEKEEGRPGGLKRVIYGDPRGPHPKEFHRPRPPHGLGMTMKEELNHISSIVFIS